MGLRCLPRKRGQLLLRHRAWHGQQAEADRAKRAPAAAVREQEPLLHEQTWSVEPTPLLGARGRLQPPWPLAEPEGLLEQGEAHAQAGGSALGPLPHTSQARLWPRAPQSVDRGWAQAEAASALLGAGALPGLQVRGEELQCALSVRPFSLEGAEDIYELLK